MNPGLYTEFASNRPSKIGLRVLRFQQSRLLKTVIAKSGEVTSVLEIGPGWGAFATHCRDLGVKYEFVDNSPTISDLMFAEGFVGLCGTTNQLQTISVSTIWMSHVLEHSPTWSEARNMLTHLSEIAQDGTRIVIIGPDYLSWRGEFFNVDSTHGYPTTLRNVVQLVRDVGLTVSFAHHHRLASTNVFVRLLAVILLSVPWNLIDRAFGIRKDDGRRGLFYNFKVNFLLRQMCVVACKPLRDPANVPDSSRNTK
jgi:hypothetical protein